ncbi:MAG: hypothetical protein K5664_07380 [Firmicutes bacterium]|nr:hypothetical protein [Bacillota bacterium]
MSNYIGITIGPIVGTLKLAHSPAAMWYASFMFSSLTELICSKIDKDKIISPYYDGTKYDDGIGRYHDRIIIRDIPFEDVMKAVEESKEKIAKRVAEDLNKPDDKEIIDFVKGYLQVHLCNIPELKENANPILELGKKLDVLELMVSPNPDNTNNPFFELLKGNKFIKNRIKNISEDSQLFKTGKNLRSIPDIASEKPEEDRTLKREIYYAVVEADGDGMGNYISSLKKDELNSFSKKCLEWAGKASEYIKEYGGMAVYAGGDDLLFLAPVYSEKSNLEKETQHVETVYGLCDFLSMEFKKAFSSDNGPTLSFGISIRREGFPLYESLDSALSALYGAKKNGGNAMLIDFEKGSGQAIKMLVPFNAYNCFKDVLSLYNTSNDNLKSAIYAIEEFKELFKLALKGEVKAENVINNTFDNQDQKKHSDFLDRFAEQFKEFSENGTDITVTELGRNCDEDTEYKRLITFEGILRLSKFMLEKKGDK